MFRKLESDEVVKNPSEIKISVKEHSTGETRAQTFHSDTERQNSINQIIPDYLSNYVFLKGEMINSIEDKIHTSGRVPDLSKAVKVMLGLQPIENALSHLKAPANKDSVLRIFEEGAADAPDIGEIYKRRVKLQTNSEKNKTQITENEDKIEELNNQISDLEKDKMEAVPDEKLKEELSIIKKKINAEKDQQSEKRSKFLKNFPALLEKYLILQAYPKIKDEIVASGVADDYRDGIMADAVQKMLDDKECMCGNSLKEGTEAREKLIKLLDAIPPKSIGGEIENFKTYGEAKSENPGLDNLESELNIYIKDIVESQTEINAANERKEEIEADLDGQKNISDIEAQIKAKKYEKSGLEADTKSLYAEQGRIETDLKQVNGEYEKVMHDNEKYNFINRCREYTEHIYKS